MSCCAVPRHCIPSATVRFGIPVVRMDDRTAAQPKPLQLWGRSWKEEEAPRLGLTRCLPGCRLAAAIIPPMTPAAGADAHGLSAGAA